MNNLPATSGHRTKLVPLRREIANVNARPERHLRHYDSGKVVVVNPDVKKKYALVPVKAGLKPPQVTVTPLNPIQVMPRKIMAPEPPKVETEQEKLKKTAWKSYHRIIANLRNMKKKILDDERHAEVSGDYDYYEQSVSELREYPLDVSYYDNEDYDVEDENYDNEGSYLQYLVSWGGPSEEFRIYNDGRVEFWYKDWFQAYKIDVSKKDAELIKDVSEWEDILEDRERQRELKDWERDYGR